MSSPALDLGSPSADMPPDASAPQCEEVTVYEDRDKDGYGTEVSKELCLTEDEAPPEEYSRLTGDCRDDDPLAHEMAEGICDDYVDDDCDGEDEACPASQPDEMLVPTWDCTGAPPENVYAWAQFEDGGDHFKAGACFVFFEGKKDVFYAQRVGVEPLQACQDKTHGCVCPSLNGWKSYDRRLYAFTTRGEPGACETIALTDHAGEEQPVSNTCRKYLYQLHRYDIPYSHVASSLGALERRLGEFSTVEIACLEDAPHQNLPFASLLTTSIERNEQFIKR